MRLSLVTLLVTLVACSAAPGTPSCGAAGRVEACVCPSGSTGAQECGPEGIWSVCACPDGAVAADVPIVPDRPPSSDAPTVDVARVEDAGHDVGPDAPPIDASVCAPGMDLCGGACVSTSTDPSHCGGCDRQCGGDPARGTVPACEVGRCVMRCALNRGDCDGMAGNGCEADLTVPANCGVCGRRCSSCTHGGDGGTFYCRVTP